MSEPEPLTKTLGHVGVSPFVTDLVCLLGGIRPFRAEAANENFRTRGRVVVVPLPRYGIRSCSFLFSDSWS